MACSIAGQPRNRPSGIIAHHQIWQLSPRLEHGCVESIDQLVWYHTQIDTPTEWRRQFCSSETRLDQYAVNSKRLAKEAVVLGGVPVFSNSRHSRPHTLVSHPPRI